MKKLWFEAYRPNKLSEYVFKNSKLRQQVTGWIKDGTLPHILLSGPAGTGKTSLAKVLLKELGVDQGDVLEINASANNGVDYIRDTITGFVSTMSFSGEIRYVLLDESDYLSQNSQAALRGVMEKYATSSRIIMTCNYPDRIIPALKSRTQALSIDTLDKDDFMVRIATILSEESVEADLETLDAFVNAYYPDMRKCINEVQLNCSDGKLHMPSSDDGDTADYKIEMIALFKAKEYIQARKLICKQIGAEEYNGVYEFLYRNTDVWSEGDPIKEKQVIITIAEGLRDHALVANPELNLSATLCKLEQIVEN